MGTSQGSLPNGGLRALTTAVGYVVLFLLGALQGLIGSFQYGQPPAPLVAIILVVVIFVTCVACGWGIGTFGAGLLPAVGWIIASFILAMARSGGSVIITATAAGEWYLYGGALACAVGSVTAFFTRLRRSAPPR
jgi:small-conductance mechanosensitive channel